MDAVHVAVVLADVENDLHETRHARRLGSTANRTDRCDDATPIIPWNRE
jgi:hypothetical protein